AARRRFMADAVRHRDIASIRNRVTALDRFPRGMLCRAEVFPFRWVPPDCCWIKNDLGAAQRGETCCLGVPLVPANADADFAVRCLPCLKSQVPGCEIKLFVIQRVIRDVHLAIFAEQFSVCVDYCRGIVVNAGAAFLEKRSEERRVGKECRSWCDT